MWVGGSDQGARIGERVGGDTGVRQFASIAALAGASAGAPALVIGDTTPAGTAAAKVAEIRECAEESWLFGDGESWVGYICGGRKAFTSLFDSATVFALEVRDSSATAGGSDSSSSRGYKDGDNGRWDTACVRALLRPLDPREKLPVESREEEAWHVRSIGARTTAIVR